MSTVLLSDDRMPEKQRTRPRGRPSAGPSGEYVRNYNHQFTTRTPGDLFHTIRAIKDVTGASYRYILTHAVEFYLAQRVAKTTALRLRN